MKILLLCCFAFMSSTLFAQTSAAATQLATRIAQKMKDTLLLTNQQRNQIFAVNIALHNRKMLIRQQYSNPDSLRIKTQRLERGRDSLYQIILPPPKYVLYLQKKRNLVSAN